MITDATFMAIAHVVANHGTCPRLQVGAILTKDRRIIASGYNGKARGLPHCIHDNQTKWDYCAEAVHAETNVVAFAAKHGQSTEGTKLYTTHSPCYSCALLLINSGIKEVVYGEKYRSEIGIDLLAEAKVHVRRYFGPTMRVVWSPRTDH